MKNKKELSIYVISFLIIIIISIISTLNQTNETKIPFDIQNPTPNGTMALYKVLENNGTNFHKIEEYEKINDIETNDQIGIVIINPTYISKKHIDELEKSKRNIIFINTQNFNSNQIKIDKNSSFETIKNNCQIKGLNKTTQISHSLYSLKTPQNINIPFEKNQKITKCFPIKNDNKTTYSLIEYQNQNNKITYISDGSIFTNKNITKNSNASLGLNYLGQYKKIYWHIAKHELVKHPPEEIKKQLLTPPAMNNIILISIIASVLFIIHKSTRLGKVVTEKLPVVSKFEENTIGKANLYRKNNDKEYTANILRTYYFQRVLKLLGLPKQTTKEDFIKKLSDTTNIKYAEIEKAYYNQRIETIQELNMLSLTLEKIEKKVKHGKQ